MIRITSWNVNSLRIREGILSRFIAAYAPDVLCLQETKVEDAHFPHALVESLGFSHVAYAGQKSYNGVAILSKLPLHEVQILDMIGNGEKRHISATLDNGVVVHNFYVPAGGDIADVTLNPKFKDKLAFVDAIQEWGKEHIRSSMPVIALGDFNIAPLEQDVWSHKQLLDVVSHTPMEVEKFTAAQQAGNWIDVPRQFVDPNEKLYSWWSYRNRDYLASNRGRRLDHLWATPALAPHVSGIVFAAETRGWESTSDHIPISMDIAL